MNVQPNHVGYRRAGRLARAFFSLFARYDFPDRPAVLDRGGVVIAANHRSFFDVFLAYALLLWWGETPRMLVNGSYFDIPVIGWMLKNTGCIPVKKGGGKIAIDDGLIELNAERPIAIMPEGRLVKPEDRPTGVGEARDGVGQLAIKSGSPVLAVGVSGAERVWPVGKPVPLPRLKRTTVVVKTRLLTDLTGSAEQAKDQIMAALADAVHEAESIAKP